MKSSTAMSGSKWLPLMNATYLAAAQPLDRRLEVVGHRLLIEVAHVAHGMAISGSRQCLLNLSHDVTHEDRDNVLIVEGRGAARPTPEVVGVYPDDRAGQGCIELPTLQWGILQRLIGGAHG
jgi:hypothetical protein